MRCDLKVQLEARVTGLQHNAVMLDDQLINSSDMELIRLTSQPGHRFIQGEVPSTRRHIGET